MVTRPGRIPCITPGCKRTAPAEKYPDSTEIICGKCFRALPADLKQQHRRCWGEINKWRRRITRTGDEVKIKRMTDLVNMWGFRLDANWRSIRRHLENPTKPAGIESFLEEMGMGE